MLPEKIAPVAAIVLAAGGSRRLGQPKQLVLLDGEPLLRRIVRLALEAGCSPIVVVLGADQQACREVLGTLPAHLRTSLRLVVHAGWAQGMSTSLRAGLAAVNVFAPDHAGNPSELVGAPESTLVLVCDQVRLGADFVERLLRAHAAHGTPATAARYKGGLGVPAVFRRELLPALAALTGDQGARRLLNSLGERVTGVDLPEAIHDLDTPEDLAALGSAGFTTEERP